MTTRHRGIAIAAASVAATLTGSGSYRPIAVTVNPSVVASCEDRRSLPTDRSDDLQKSLIALARARAQISPRFQRGPQRPLGRGVPVLDTGRGRRAGPVAVTAESRDLFFFDLSLCERRRKGRGRPVE